MIIPNKIFNYFLITIILSTSLTDLNGQAINNAGVLSTESRGFGIGDEIPDIALSKVIGYPEKTINLRDFKGKIIILDFWATWCGPCVAGMSELEALQKNNKNILQIISVTTEETDHVKDFLNKQGRKLGIPIITEDTILNKFFRHRIIPHFVWIDQNLHIKGITTENEVCQKNIDEMVVNNAFTLQTKSDLLNFDQDKPLFVDGNAGNGSNFIARSILTKPIEGLSGRIKIDIDHNRNISRIQAVNCSILGLFSDAYSRMRYGGVNMTRIALKGKKAMENHPNNYSDSWNNDKIFCYELIMPKKIPDSIFFNYMLDDLNRYFEVKGEITERPIECWVMKRVDESIPLPVTHGGNPNFTNGIFRNVPMSRIIEELNVFTKVEPIIDETSITTNVDMILDINFNWNIYPDILKLKEKLKKYGIDIIKEKRNYKIIEVRDKD